MHGSRRNLDAAPPRVWLARGIYGALLVAGALALSREAELARMRMHLVTLAALVGLSLCGYCITHDLLARVGRVFDMSIALAIAALIVAGPLAAFVVAVAPDLIHLARRRRAFLNLGLCANVVSWMAAALVGALILGAAHDGDMLAHAARLVATGVLMMLANYAGARLLLGVVRDRQVPARLLRGEFVALLPLELTAVITGVACGLMLGPVGVFGLLGFTGFAYLLQLVVAQLLRAPSVAALSVDAAAEVYRDALADELRLTRADRRLVRLVDALVQRRSLPEAPLNPLTAIQDAMLVTICTARPPTQRHFSATPTSQVVLVARDWARLTARCTPALNHHEALSELRGSGLAQDAPLAVAAAARIVAREDAFTEHVAGVPRLHRAPLPRTLRQGLLPVALGRLAA